MPSWVIDASVAAKWLLPEEGSDHASALLGDALLVPDLLFAELANVFWKKQVRCEIDTATADAAMRWLMQAPLQVHSCAGLAAQAMSLSIRIEHPAYDCFYLALARRSGCPLVTADRRLVERCQRADAVDLRALLVLLGGKAGQERH